MYPGTVITQFSTETPGGMRPNARSLFATMSGENL